MVSGKVFVCFLTDFEFGVGVETEGSEEDGEDVGEVLEGDVCVAIVVESVLLVVGGEIAVERGDPEREVVTLEDAEELGEVADDEGENEEIEVGVPGGCDDFVVDSGELGADEVDVLCAHKEEEDGVEEGEGREEDVGDVECETEPVEALDEEQLEQAELDSVVGDESLHGGLGHEDLEDSLKG